MPRRKETTITSRKGVNYLRTIVENTGSIFNEIHQENDVGIDAIVELFVDEKPINKLVAFQVKSGSSFYDKKNDLCLLPVENHFDYWMNYSIPLYGLVYVPALSQGYWVNIKEHLTVHGKVNVIKFQPKTINTLSEEYFQNVFSPLVSKELPKISFDEALSLLHSKHQDEVAIGLTTLFKKFAGENRTWDAIVGYFRNSNIENIPTIITYYFAHVPWHPDIFYFKESYTTESKEYAKQLIESFTKNDIIKLISFVDEENLIARGTPGQNVRAIVPIITDIESKLFDIIQDRSLDLHIRAVAAVLYAYCNGNRIEDVKQFFDEDEPWFVHVMIDAILEDPNHMPL